MNILLPPIWIWGIDTLLLSVWIWGINILLPPIWIWDDGMLATGVLVGVLTAILILVSSPQLIEEADSSRYGIDIKYSFEFNCLDFIFTYSKC